MKRNEAGFFRYVVAVAFVVVPATVFVADKVKARYAEGVERYVARAAEREARRQAPVRVAPVAAVAHDAQ
jgi:hypothetical protein